MIYNGDWELPLSIVDFIFTLLQREKIDSIAIFGHTCSSLYYILNHNHNIQSSDIFNYLPTSYACPTDAPIRKNYLTTPFIGSDNKLRKFSHIIASNILPFGMKIPDTFKPEKDKYKRFLFSPKSLEQANLMHIIASLNENGKAIVFSTLGLLTRKFDLEMRKFLLSNNLIESIILLPDDKFGPISPSVPVLILNKTKKDDKILFVNASVDFERFLDCYRNNEVLEGYSLKVSRETIASHNFSLNQPLYVGPTQKQLASMELHDIKNDVLNIETQLSVVKKKLAQNLEKLGGVYYS